MSIGIYKITNPKGKIYIGQSVNIEKRFENYLCLNCNRQKILFNSFQKYGIEDHKFEIIEECKIGLLKKREKYWINFYNSYNNGLNSNKGGGGVLFHTKETKNKISNTKIKNYKKPSKDLINRYRKSSPHKKKVFQYDLEGKFIQEFPSINEAARKLEIKNDDISLCIRGKQKTGKNFQWFDSYYEKVEPIKKYQKPQKWKGNRNIEIDKYIDEIINKYQKGYSIYKLSLEYEVHRDVIKKRIKENNIKLRNRGRQQKNTTSN